MPKEYDLSTIEYKLSRKAAFSLDQCLWGDAKFSLYLEQKAGRRLPFAFQYIVQVSSCNAQFTGVFCNWAFEPVGQNLIVDLEITKVHAQ